MEYNHKFSQISSSYNHKFGFDRNVLEHQQHNTLVSLPSEDEVKELDISKDNMKSKRKKKSNNIPTQK